MAVRMRAPAAAPMASLGAGRGGHDARPGIRYRRRHHSPPALLHARDEPIPGPVASRLAAC